MILSINNNNENIIMDYDSNIDLFDFGNLVEKYMGYEAYTKYISTIKNLYSYVDELEGSVQLLQDKLSYLEDQQGEDG